jgi:hypothetical protein
VRKKCRTLDRKFLYGCTSIYGDAFGCYLTGEEIPPVSNLTIALIYVFFSKYLD